MGLPWVRLDTQFATNPKVLNLVSDKRFRAAFVYITGLGYAGAHGTEGFLPAACLPFLHGTKSDAAALVDVGLWVATPGGWEINGWAEFQPTNIETQERKRRARDAAMARWHPD